MSVKLSITKQYRPNGVSHTSPRHPCTKDSSSISARRRLRQHATNTIHAAGVLARAAILLRERHAAILSIIR